MVQLEASYAKKVGLPNYSSHQFGLTVKIDISDPGRIKHESTRLYDSLQSCVDRELRKMGYLGDNAGGNRPGNGDGNPAPLPVDGDEWSQPWACTPRQKNLVVKLVQEHQLDRNSVEGLAKNRFTKSLKALSKLEASAMIDELLSQVAAKNSSAAPVANARTEQEEAA